MNAPRTRVQRRPVHGVLLLDKPLGLSSNQALQKVKWLLRAEKAGHTGTLDPLATGVLPLCFGAATKFSQMHLDADKAYEALLRLGQTTTTGDAEGEVLRERPVQLSSETIEAVLQRFVGVQQQIPPMHSALKKDGKALYEYARAGQVVERAPRTITVSALDRLEVLAEVQAACPPGTVLRLRASVSKGTYIRTLAEDIGEALGCGAHLIGLRRVQTGAYDLQRCITLEALEAMDAAGRLGALLPPDVLLTGHVPVMLDTDDAARFLTGLRRRGGWSDAPQVAVYGPVPAAEGTAEPETPRGGPDRVLLGTAHIQAGQLIPTRVLSPLEIAQWLQQQAEITVPTEVPS